jgi:hypothetical protein
MNGFIGRLAALWLMTCALSLRADVLSLSNGDRFVGSIELVNATEVHIKSEVLGLMKVPRAKVVSIYFGTNQPAATSIVGERDASIPGLKLDAKAVEKVQDDFLATAGPEANAMFKDLIQGLTSGKLSVDDIRDQARASLEELKDLQKEIGDDGDNPLLQSYVGILQNFINKGSTNRAKTVPPKGKPTPKSDDE